jgi:hypothetical protein
MDNYKQTIISQYANSPTLLQLIESMNDYIDPAADFATFYDYVWNVDTAKGFGLDIWGRIVGIGRYLTIPNPAPIVLGFDEGQDYQPFDQAPFYDGGPNTITYTLDDDSFRTLILVKALGNISSCTAASLNQLLRNLFVNRGRCYVNDLGGMRMRFVFEFYLAPFEIAILRDSGAIPRPAAVESEILQIIPELTFGFEEANGTPFDVGTFYN